MKRMIYTALLCCSLLGVAYGQDKSRDKSQDNSHDKGTKETSCTIRDSGWGVDVKVAEAHDRQREVHCTERREPEPKEPKEPKTPKDKQ